MSQELGQLLNPFGSLAANDSVDAREMVRSVRSYRECLGFDDAAGRFHDQDQCLLVAPVLEEPVALIMHVRCVSGDLAVAVDIDHLLRLLGMVPYEFQEVED